MEEFTIVDERPPAQRGRGCRHMAPLTQAVFDTLQSGQSVRLEVAGRKQQHAIAAKYYIAAKRHGLVAHARYRTDHLLLWVEPGLKEAAE